MIDFVTVRFTVVIRVGVTGIGAVELFLNIGQLVAVLIVVTVAETVVVNIGQEGARVGIELVEVGETVAVEVAEAVAAEIAKVGNLPLVGHTVAIKVCFEGDRRFNGRYNDRRASRQQRRIPVVVAPVLRQRVVGCVTGRTGIQRQFVMVEAQVGSHAASEDDVAIRLDLACRFRTRPDAGLVDHTIETFTYDSHCRPRSVDQGLERNQAPRFLGTVDINTQTFIVRIEDRRQMRPGTNRDVVDCRRFDLEVAEHVCKAGKWTARDVDAQLIVDVAGAAANDDTLGVEVVRIHPRLGCPAAAGRETATDRQDDLGPGIGVGIDLQDSVVTGVGTVQWIGAGSHFGAVGNAVAVSIRDTRITP